MTQIIFFRGVHLPHWMREENQLNVSKSKSLSQGPSETVWSVSNPGPSGSTFHVLIQLNSQLYIESRLVQQQLGCSLFCRVLTSCLS